MSTGDFEIFDDTSCVLGEGALWHPVRAELFWFDILGRRLHAPGRHWVFEDMPSCAGWIDRDRLLVATNTALVLLDIETGAQERLCDFDSANPVTRSNDGRADPNGGFYVSTMGIDAEPGAGALYRYYRGELRQVRSGMTIPNAICFPPESGFFHYSDTPTGMIMRQRTDEAGWPVGEAEVFVDCKRSGHNPDGAVIDAEGTLWNAQWGSSRVAGYDRDGREIAALDCPTAPQLTCPAFGGEDMKTMFVTSATAGLSEAEIADAPDSGRTFRTRAAASGQKEHRVIL
ncbi:SMP-30/gluconolactonase/LRE family protein [Limimaricola variabilis]|uniref:SMP-30/gluconolactonase/LRE family protein n=1 Tax=Limimaricola variabilis TaxID=1492771 RepID=UPI002AC8F61C|nr:SMP-30/gluconolactonase/LRE family protein [Limimaricola variabilis]WPY94242.1 SMP-30/gluconolactonase/LRE family protein [Limimaricola variabilis]